MSEQSARYQRSPGGLVAALGVLVVVVIAYAVVKSLLLPSKTSPGQVVDYAQVVPQARQAARFALLAPASLPPGWRATSVRYTDGVGSHWHLGVLTGQDRYVGLEQGRQSVVDLVAAYVDPAASRGSRVVVHGQTWSTYTDPGGDLALARHAGRTSTLVVGHDVGGSALASYAARLR